MLFEQAGAFGSRPSSFAFQQSRLRGCRLPGGAAGRHVSAPAGNADFVVSLVAVWVDPAAGDADAVYENNRRATYEALRAGTQRRPALADLLAAREEPRNPFFRPR